MTVCKVCGRAVAEGMVRCPACEKARMQENARRYYERKRYEARACARCGTPLPIPHGAQQKKCDACQRAIKEENIRKAQRARAGRNAPAPTEAPKPRRRRTWPAVKPHAGMSLDEVVRGAEQEGLSYGQYTAKYGI